MRVIFVEKPMQSSETLDLQVIDDKIYYWSVNSEAMKIGESFQEWWKRKQEWMITHSQGQDLTDGIFVYDFQPIAGIVGAPNKSAMIIRYQWIKKVKIDEDIIS